MPPVCERLFGREGFNLDGRISEKLAKLNGVATHLTLAQILQAVGCEEDECSASGASLTLLANLVDLDRRQLLSTGGMEVRGLIVAVKTAAACLEMKDSDLSENNNGFGSRPQDILMPKRGDRTSGGDEMELAAEKRIERESREQIHQ